jgi:hypothetical protein
MRKALIASLAAVGLFAAGLTTSAVLAKVSQTVPGPVYKGPAPTVADCAEGFSKKPSSALAWTCVANVECPSAAQEGSNLSGGLGNPSAKPTKSGANFSYECSYFAPPK